MSDDDLKTCETCGLHWSAHPEERCPRCALAESGRRLEEVLHQLDMLERDIRRQLGERYR